jgi:hypothetical protein
VAEKQYFRRGNPSAECLKVRLLVLQLPVIVLLVCLFPGMEPEPKHSPPAHADHSGPSRVREDLAAVQVELMQVMRTDPERTCLLQQREEQLKYELRTDFGTPRS